MNSNTSYRRRSRTRPGNQRPRFSGRRDNQNPTSRRPYRKSLNRGRNLSKSKLNERRRLKIQNLNKDFQNSELKKLFEPFGKLIRCGIHFNKMGESTGIADIEFSSHEECENAINKLDNAEINGVKLRVKYADFGPKTGRRISSLGNRRRNLREMNRENRRNRNGNNRTIRRGRPNSRNNLSSTGTRRRRIFKRIAGRKKN